jgi:uncharacterized protein YecT (DUF1311 family)
MHRYVASLMLTAALTLPMSILAASQDRDQEHRDQDRRVYDSRHKDYHNWDAHENEAWHRYNSENHRKDHEFTRASKREQENYWNWRHSHPD